ncbi:hypothetical protein FA13DRAFT_1744785 [Coprinellus micaceus]|uniref:Uncharacterized protein n=1 Tax=Coprinellus micaceus TaxID=71717 RepID=A0A4Y7SBV0_COPMI|nr:hypothetical protein FA13DRAFT_1744785 [Coprinellus micaceus]
MIVPHDTIRGFRGTISSPTKCLLLGLTTQFNGYQKCSGDLCGYDARGLPLALRSLTGVPHPGVWGQVSAVTQYRCCLRKGASVGVDGSRRRTIFPLRPPRQPARNTITGIKSKITLARVLPCRILLREDSRGVSLDHDGQSV